MCDIQTLHMLLKIKMKIKYILNRLIHKVHDLKIHIS